MSTKGARSRAEVDPAYLDALNRGEASTRTLPEMLAMDLAALLARVAPDLPDGAAASIDPAAGITARMAAAGRLLAGHFGPEGFGRFAAHPSDTVRGWVAYLLGALPGLPLADRLGRIRPLADDPHFGVREWAWIALRPHVAAGLAEAPALLEPWTAEPSANLRRFAVEITRPRGVWCAHLGPWKADPSPGLPLLEPVRADPARYVQDSVGNWLNDAARTRPDVVRDLCARWRLESPGPETLRICTRALRNLAA